MAGVRTIGDWITGVPIGVMSGRLTLSVELGGRSAGRTAGLLAVRADGTPDGCAGACGVTVGKGAGAGFRAVRVAGVGRGEGASWAEALGAGAFGMGCCRITGVAFGAAGRAGGAAMVMAVGGAWGASAGGLLSLPQWKMRVDMARGSPPCPGGPEPTIVITSPDWSA
jgi:hypothetical protein